MIRSRTLLALAGLAVVAGLAGCGDESANTPAKLSAPSAAVLSTPTAAESLTPERLDTIYLDATAVHVCSVQSRVYANPSAMADAFGSSPQYTSLTDAQVQQYQQRIVAEPAFATRLTERIQQTCGSATK